VLVAAVGALYVGIVLALAPCHGFWSGDAGVKLWQMEAWIANDWRTPWAAYADANAGFDPDHSLAPLGAPFAVWDGNRVLTIYTLPYVFGSSLLLAAGGRLALYAPSLVAGVGGLGLAVRVGHAFSGRVAFLAVLALGLTTSWLFYSVTFWGHTVAGLLIWAALALTLSDWDEPPSRLRAGITAGLCLGAAAMARPEAAISALALVAVLAVQRSAWRKLAWLALGLGLTGLAGLVYQVIVGSQVLGGQAAMNFRPSAFESRLWSIDRLVGMSQMVVESRRLGVGVIVAGGLGVFVLARLYRRLRPANAARAGLAVECLGLALVAAGVAVLVLRGHHPMDLLFGAPAAGLAFLGLGGGIGGKTTGGRWRRQLAAWCALVVILSIVLGRQDGGWQWGPRYLTPLLGPLVLLGIECWQRLERQALSALGRYALWAALAALVAAGAVVQAAGVVKLWRVRAGNHALAQAMLSSPSPDIIVTDLWFVPQIAPQVYGELPLLLVRTPEQWDELERRLAAQSVGRVRLVRLPDRETPLVGSVSRSWRAERTVEVATIPPLTVVDYAP
jgi:hypothetical protein